MVNKKKQYCRAYRQKKGDLYTANDAARKKAVRERRKYLEPRKYKVFKKEESRVLPVSGNIVIKKDVRAITGQHCNVNFRNNTRQVFSIFNKTYFESKCSQD